MIDKQVINSNGQRNYKKNIIYGLSAIIAGIALFASSFYRYPLFHSLTELFSIVIALSIFVIAWNTRILSPNAYLLFIGISYLFVAIIDLLHTLGYRGMGIFSGGGANLSTQLWIAGRYMQGISFLVAPYFIERKLKTVAVLIIYFFASATSRKARPDFTIGHYKSYENGCKRIVGLSFGLLELHKRGCRKTIWS